MELPNSSLQEPAILINPSGRDENGGIVVAKSEVSANVHGRKRDDGTVKFPSILEYPPSFIPYLDRQSGLSLIQNWWQVVAMKAQDKSGDRPRFVNMLMFSRSKPMRFTAQWGLAFEIDAVPAPPDSPAPVVSFKLGIMNMEYGEQKISALDVIHSNSRGISQLNSVCYGEIKHGEYLCLIPAFDSTKVTPENISVLKTSICILPIGE